MLMPLLGVYSRRAYLGTYVQARPSTVARAMELVSSPPLAPAALCVRAAELWSSKSSVSGAQNTKSCGMAGPAALLLRISIS